MRFEAHRKSGDFESCIINIFIIKDLYDGIIICSRPAKDRGKLKLASAAPEIVVIDDSPSIKALFEKGTKGSDIELKVFGSAEKSLEYLQQSQPALLFLNIKMPGKDGLTFLKELRHLPLHKDTSVVMISSKDYAQDRSVAEKLGALEFITKPMPIQVITDVIHKYLQPSGNT